MSVFTGSVHVHGIAYLPEKLSNRKEKKKYSSSFQITTSVICYDDNSPCIDNCLPSDTLAMEALIAAILSFSLPCGRRWALFP